jgi:hypothetical protein
VADSAVEHLDRHVVFALNPGVVVMDETGVSVDRFRAKMANAHPFQPWKSPNIVERNFPHFTSCWTAWAAAQWRCTNSSS